MASNNPRMKDPPVLVATKILSSLAICWTISRFVARIQECIISIDRGVINGINVWRVFVYVAQSLCCQGLEGINQHKHKIRKELMWEIHPPIQRLPNLGLSCGMRLNIPLHDYVLSLGSSSPDHDNALKLNALHSSNLLWLPWKRWWAAAEAIGVCQDAGCDFQFNVTQLRYRYHR